MRSDIKLTPSRVREYALCPLKFARLYGPADEYPSLGTKPAEGPGSSANKALSAAMSLSNSLHSALDTLHRPAPQVLTFNESYSAQTSAQSLSTLSDQELSSIVSRHWQSDGYEDSHSEEAAYLQACDLLKYYVRSPYTPTGLVLATESYLTALTTIEGYRVELSCRADRIELHQDGVIEVLDYKLSSSGKLPTARELADDLASFVYFLLIAHHYKRNPKVRAVRISQLNLLNLTKVEVEYDQEHIARHKEALTNLVQTVMGGSLEPRVHAGCAWCPVREACPAWSELDMDGLTDLTGPTSLTNLTEVRGLDAS